MMHVCYLNRETIRGTYSQYVSPCGGTVEILIIGGKGMKTKYWAIGLSLALVLVLVMVACSQQASQEPQEPAQTAQTTEPVEPVTTEPIAAPVESEPQEEPKQPEVTEPVEVKESDPVDEVVETVPVETTPEPIPVSTQKPAETKPQEVAQQGGGEIDTSGDRDAFINGLNDIRKQNGGSEGADHAITPEEAAGIAQSVSLEVGGQQSSADGDSSGELTQEQKEQSIADALSGLTGKGPGDSISPDDPEWDDYASGIANLLQPTN